jgi:putative transcriptional regulator
MKTKHDWTRADAMTAEEIHAAALSDPDNPPLTESELASMRRVPFARAIRLRLRLSQEEFASRFEIPVGTLRDWEQGRKEPDTAARAYLTVIGHSPNTVRRALEEQDQAKRAPAKSAELAAP